MHGGVFFCICIHVFQICLIQMLAIFAHFSPQNSAMGEFWKHYPKSVLSMTFPLQQNMTTYLANSMLRVHENMPI